MSIRNFFRALAVVAAIATASQASAAVLLVNGSGMLTGATGVDVGGTLYNVTFFDGTCAQVFGGCTQSNFAFSTFETALTASQALSDQVFVDGPAGQFDSSALSTFGCTSFLFCSTAIPYSRDGANALLAFALNFSAGWGGDFVDPTPRIIDSAYDTSESPAQNFAVFKLAAPAAVTVPEPSSIALMALALFGLAFTLRRKA